ncbi:MAG: hypothetical protein JOZ39_10630, partial [Chloroflexi bacterium]|nr:hypothetical protein [Chloroflexota bacterium]
MAVWRALPPVRQTDSVTALGLAAGLELAGTPAGVFKRAPSGHWERVALAATEIQAIAIGGEPEVIGVGAGSGVDVSPNRGRTWTHADLPTEGRVTALGLAGATLMAGTDLDGVFRSTNAGASWHQFGLQGQMVLAIYGEALVGTDQGLWARDEARGWRKLSLDGVCTAVAQSTAAILAGTEEQGLQRSTDGGATWARCSGVADGINALAVFGEVAVAGASTGQVYRSTDGGDTW